MLGPDTVREASEKVDLIRRRMKEAQDRQKSYADRRRKDLEFSVGDHVFVKVTPLKGVMRFSKTGKLAPRFIGLILLWSELENLPIELPYLNTYRVCTTSFMCLT